MKKFVRNFGAKTNKFYKTGDQNKLGARRNVPATEKQLKFLRDLGVEPAKDLTIRQAAIEISLALMNNRKVEKYVSAAMNYDLDD